MGQFQYSPSKTVASVHFQAHKFPYTASVYYQCNVRLCIKADHGCDDVVRISTLFIGCETLPEGVAAEGHLQTLLYFLT